MSLFLGAIIKKLQRIWEAKALFVRAVLCLIVGIVVLISEQDGNFDTRYKIRGNVLKSKDITLILISEDEWLSIKGRGYQTLRPLKEIESLTDSFFGDSQIWETLLAQVLKQNPTSIGITLFLRDGFTDQANKTLHHPKVFWGARLDADGQLLRPKGLGVMDQNIGLVDLKSDADGYVRRFTETHVPIPTLSYKLARTTRPQLQVPLQENTSINYQGPASTFLTFTLTEALYGQLPESAIRDRIVIIGVRGLPSHTLLTPVGPLSKAEVIANMTTNMIYQQWPKSLPTLLSLLLLIILLVLSIWITTGYSQTVALSFLACIWALHVAVSTYIFDSIYLWIPIVAPSAQMAVTFVIFLSYQLIMNEKENWKLQQEKKYLEEIEEIKNNFLSLVSHDLKTPIAKIQAVADRILSQLHDEKITQDMKVVKSASQDLHRYIQSLLQVARVESTDFQARRIPADINELIVKAIEDLKVLADEKNIELTSHLEPMFSVEIDTTLILEVIINFLENAIKYTPSGGRVSVYSTETDDSIEFKVVDTGEGIPPDEINKVWNKFYRGKKHDMSTKGSGLGLYLSRYFIQLHGGTVFLNSQLGQGTEIGFRLPLTLQDSDDSLE